MLLISEKWLYVLVAFVSLSLVSNAFGISINVIPMLGIITGIIMWTAREP